MAWLEAFEKLKDRIGLSVGELYKLLPRQDRGGEISGDVMVLCRALYHTASERPMWQLHNRQLVKISEGYFLQPLGSAEEPGALAREWITRQLPLFDVPREVKLEMDAAGVKGCADLTPAGVRPLLKAVMRPGRGGSSQPSLTTEEATELLQFCMADVPQSSPPAAAVEPEPQAGAPPRREGLLAVMDDRAPSLDVPWQAFMTAADAAARELQGIVTSVRDAIATDLPAGQASAPLGGQEEQQQVRCPINSAALNDCRGLPVPTAAGNITLLGKRQLLVWPHDARVAPVKLALDEVALGIFVHPLVVQHLGPLLQATPVQEGLRLANFTLEHLSGMLPAALPPNWAPHHSRAVGPVVPWQPPIQSKPSGAPSVPWLRDLWVLAMDMATHESGTESAGPWAALDMWPLLPINGNRLLRVRHHLAILPSSQPPKIEQAQVNFSCQRFACPVGLSVELQLRRLRLRAESLRMQFWR